MKNSQENYQASGRRAAIAMNEKSIERYNVERDWFNAAQRSEVGHRAHADAYRWFDAGYRNARVISPALHSKSARR